MAELVEQNSFNQSRNSNILRNNSQQNNDLLKENQYLKNSIRQLQLKMKKNNNDEFQELFEQNQQLQQYIQQIEEEYESLQVCNKQLERALKNKVTNDMEDNDEMVKHLEKIKDPNSIILINQLLESIKLNDKQGQRSTYGSQVMYKTQSRLHQSIDIMEKKTKKLEFENKALKEELKTMQSGQQFLENQLNFAERKLKNNNIEVNFESENILQETCQIFGINNPNELIENSYKIKQVYEIVPELQTTLEDIYKIVTQESCFPVMCDSNDQLIEILQNWSQNLHDYQSLVDQLFEILKINDESFKNRTYLLSQIKELTSFISIEDLQNKDLKNSKIFNQVEQLKQSQTSFQFFCDEAKKKLNLQHYSNEALFNKILLIIDEKNIQKNNKDF